MAAAAAPAGAPEGAPVVAAEVAVDGQAEGVAATFGAVVELKTAGAGEVDRPRGSTTLPLPLIAVACMGLMVAGAATLDAARCMVSFAEARVLGVVIQGAPMAGNLAGVPLPHRTGSVVAALLRAVRMVVGFWGRQEVGWEIEGSV